MPIDILMLSATLS